MTALERLRNACLDTALDYEAATEAVMKSSKHKHRQRKSLFQKQALRLKTGLSNKAKLEAEIGKKAGDAEASSSKLEELSRSIATGEKHLAVATIIRKICYN